MRGGTKKRNRKNISNQITINQHGAGHIISDSCCKAATLSDSFLISCDVYQQFVIIWVFSCTEQSINKYQTSGYFVCLSLPPLGEKRKYSGLFSYTKFGECEYLNTATLIVSLSLRREKDKSLFTRITK